MLHLILVALCIELTISQNAECLLSQVDSIRNFIVSKFLRYRTEIDRALEYGRFQGLDYDFVTLHQYDVAKQQVVILKNKLRLGSPES